ncbi:MAG TPA: PQQ-binding-like beta-propeller repeat protein [Aggregatilineales bacterium]|nr:PQQ-binding-like beta-propeller repeat protein [Aggregatilineales bacterium]
MPSLLSRRSILGTAFVFILLLAACGPAPLGVGWPAISLANTTCGENTYQHVIVAFNDRVVLVDPADGSGSALLNNECEPRPPEADGRAKVWDFRGTGQNQFFALPSTLDEQTLIAMNYAQRIYEIDTATARANNGEGSALPERTGHAVAQPLVNGDLIYFGLANKDLVAWNRSDNTLAWAVPTAHGVWSSPLLYEGVLYFTSLDHNLYAADAASGELLWKLDIEGAAASTPLLHDGILYVGSFARKIFAISLEGEKLAEYTTVDWVWGTPTIHENVLYAADLVGNVYALDITNNLSQIWQQKVAARAIRATPVVYEDRVIVGSRDQRIYWLNRDNGTPVQDGDGQPLVREVPSEVLSDVLVIEPTETNGVDETLVVVATLNPAELLIAYSLEQGELKWTYRYQ